MFVLPDVTLFSHLSLHMAELANCCLFNHVYFLWESWKLSYWDNFFGWKWFMCSLALENIARYQLSWIDDKSLDEEKDYLWLFLFIYL